MDTRQKLNFSTDLLRMSNWIYFGQENLVEKFIKICEEKYQIPDKYKYLFEMIINRAEDKYRAADAASTLSRLII